MVMSGWKGGEKGLSSPRQEEKDDGSNTNKLSNGNIPLLELNQEDHKRKKSKRSTMKREEREKEKEQNVQKVEKDQ
jgi:hypothetical protein